MIARFGDDFKHSGKIRKNLAVEGAFCPLICYNRGKAGGVPDGGGSMWELLLAAGIPSVLVSAVVSVCMKRLERRERRRIEEEKRRDLDRRRLELLQIRGTLAAMSLGEATATALKNGHANGETDKALAYEQRVKHEMREFLEESGVEHVA